MAQEPSTNVLFTASYKKKQQKNLTLASRLIKERYT